MIIRFIPTADIHLGKAKEVYAIGDAETPGYIVDAIAAGAKIGHSL